MDQSSLTNHNMEYKSIDISTFISDLFNSIILIVYIVAKPFEFIHFKKE